MSLLENLFAPGTMERLGWMLVHVLWQATAVALLLAVFLRLLRNAGANIRYAAACAALALMVVLPLVTIRYVQTPGPVAEAGPASVTVALSAVTEGTTAKRSLSVPDSGYVLPTEGTPKASLSVPPLAQAAEPMTPIPLRERIVSALEPVLPYVVVGWLIGVFGLSTWHLGGWTQLQRLKRRMVHEIGDPLQRRLEELSARLGLHRAVGLLESALVEVPTVVGWLRPVILLPASALTGLTPEQLEAILAHELAHIRRYDYLVNMLQTVVEILGFYHPAIWWVSHRIRIERENCCDDLAVYVCGSSLQYAKALACMEEIRHGGTDLAVAATGGSLVARIARLLGRPAVEDRRFAWLPGLIALLLVAGILLPAALVLGTPQPPPVVESAAPAVTSPNHGSTAPDAAPSNVENASGSSKAEPALVLLDFKVVKVSDDWRPDREIMTALANVLGTESRFVREFLRPGQGTDMPLGEILRRYVAPESLSDKAVDTIISLLGSRGYLSVLSAPRVETVDGQSARMRTGGSYFLPGPDPSAKPEKIDYGTTMDVTPRVLDAHRVNLNMMLEVGDLVLEPDASQPTVARTSAEVNVTAANGRYLLWAALEPPATATDPEAKRHSVYVMVKPRITLPPQGLSNAAAAQEPAGAPPRRVLLDVRTATMERSALGTLSIPWNQPSGSRTGYLPDRTFTEPVLTMLDLLQQNHQAEISNQQILAENVQQSRIKNITEEWFTCAAPSGTTVRKIDSGTILSFRPHVSRVNILRLDINVNTTVRRPPEPGSDLPTRATRETQTSVAIQDGSTVALAGFPVDSDDPDNTSSRESVLLVTAHLVNDSEDPALPASPSAESRPPAPPANDEAAQILLEFRIAKVAGDLRPDRETLLLLANAVGAESPLARALGRSGGRLNLTLGEILKRYVVPQSLSQPAAQALLDLLQSRGYLDLLTEPHVVAQNNKQAQIRMTTGEQFWMPPGSSKLERIGYGMAMDVTPHVTDDNRVALDLMVELTEPVPGVADSNQPKVSRTSAETSMVAPNDRHLVWAAVEQEPDQSAADKGRQSLYVMVKPQILQPTSGYAGPAGKRKSGETHPRQLLLDVRTATMERDGLSNLNVEWGWPTVKAGTFPPPSGGAASPSRGNDWPYGVQIGYTPDRTFTDSLLLALNLLQENGQARVSGQQILAQDGHRAQIKALTEEWHTVTTAAPEAQKTESGTVVTVMPRMGGNSDILLEITVETSTSLPRKGGDLPLVTRRTAKNAVTIRDGGTVAVAGLTENRAGSNGKSGHEIAIFVTAHLIPDVNDLMARAKVQWKQQQYGAALGHLEALLAIDPLHDEALTLKQMVQDMISLRKQIGLEGQRTEWTVRQEPPAPLDPINIPLCKQLDVEVDLSGLTPTTALATAIDMLRRSVDPPVNIVVLWRDLHDTLNVEPTSSINMTGPAKVKLGRALETLVKAVSDPVDKTKQVGFRVNKGVIIIGTTTGLTQVSEERTNNNAERRQEATIMATFTDTDLLHILEEMSQRTSVKIATDLTVKPTPITADLTDVPVETALRQVLRNTPYTFRRLHDGTYLVFRPLSFTFPQVELIQALQDLSNAAGVPIIPDPDVTGPVNATFENVCLEDALELLLAGKPYVFKKMPHYYLVADRSLSGRAFVDLSETRRIRLNYTQPSRVKAFLSPVFAPYVQVEPSHTPDPNDEGNTLIVTASPTLIDRIMKDIQEIDRPRRQVLLDARVVVLEPNDLRSLGVEWAWPTIRSINLAPGAPPETTVPPFGYVADRAATDSLMMTLNLLQENNRADIIANPKVVAQDGRRAEIKVTQEEWFRMTIPDPGSHVDSAKVSKIGSHMILAITPRVGDNNDIMLEMAVEISESIPKARGGDLPLVTRRTVRNIVTVQDGGMVAVRGLAENRSKSSEKRVPMLADIPLLGELFKNRNNGKAGRELAIFVTAHLVPERGTPNAQNR